MALVKSKESLVKQPLQRRVNIHTVDARAQKARIKKQQVNLQNQINSAKTLLSNTSPENYQQVYNSLPGNVKQYFETPTKYLARPEIKTYFTQKAIYDKQVKDQADYEHAYRKAMDGKPPGDYGNHSPAYEEGFKAGVARLTALIDRRRDLELAKPVAEATSRPLGRIVDEIQMDRKTRTQELFKEASKAGMDVRDYVDNYNAGFNTALKGEKVKGFTSNTVYDTGYRDGINNKNYNDYQSGNFNVIKEEDISKEYGKNFINTNSEMLNFIVNTNLNEIDRIRDSAKGKIVDTNKKVVEMIRGMYKNPKGVPKYIIDSNIKSMKEFLDMKDSVLKGYGKTIYASLDTQRDFLNTVLGYKQNYLRDPKNFNLLGDIKQANLEMYNKPLDLIPNDLKPKDEAQILLDNDIRNSMYYSGLIGGMAIGNPYIGAPLMTMSKIGEDLEWTYNKEKNTPDNMYTPMFANFLADRIAGKDVNITTRTKDMTNKERLLWRIADGLAWAFVMREAIPQVQRLGTFAGSKVGAEKFVNEVFNRGLVGLQSGYYSHLGHMGFRGIRDITHGEKEEGYKKIFLDVGGELAGFKIEPYVIGKVDKLFSRKDIILADQGEMVALKDRIKQVEDILGGRFEYAIRGTSNLDDMGKYSEIIKDKSNPDYFYGIKQRWATYNVNKIMPTSKLFITQSQGRKYGKPNIEILKVGNAVEPIRLTETKKSEIINKLLDNTKLDDETGRWLAGEAQRQATEWSKKRGHRVDVATLSPKRIHGFEQPEMEMSLVAPKGEFNNYKVKRGGRSEGGATIFTQENFGNILKGHLMQDVTKEFSSVIAKEKLDYLSGEKRIFGEYGKHGKEHLNPMRRLNKYYPLHDITKVGDTDSFSRLPHGEEARKLFLRNMLIDNSKLSQKEIRMIADAFGGHEYVRFNLKSLFTNPSTGKFTFPNSKQLYWSTKNALKNNPHLENVATLDRIDLERFGIEVNRDFLSENALRRLADNGKIQEDIEILRKLDEGKGLTKEELSRIIADTFGNSNYKYKNEIYKGTDYKYPLFKSYEGKGKYEQPYYKESSYTPEETPEGDYIPTEPYQTYTKVGEPPPPPPYTPYITEYPDGGPPPDKPTGGILPLFTDGKVIGFEPIMIDDNGKETSLGKFKDEKGAISQGMKVTDIAPEQYFKVRKIIAEEDELLEGTDNPLNYKFKKSKNGYREKKKYRYDKKKERSFNIMKLLQQGRGLGKNI